MMQAYRRSLGAYLSQGGAADVRAVPPSLPSDLGRQAGAAVAQEAPICIIICHAM